MKPKQLANVLIKILGLSMVAQGIPSLISTLISMWRIASDNHSYNTSVSEYSLMWFILLPTIAVGIALILGSRWLVEKLFKDEAE
jgi:hypothetical protein